MRTLVAATGAAAGGAGDASAAGTLKTPGTAGAAVAFPAAWGGSDNVARTGAFRPSANMASRGPTALSRYPGAISAPTTKGRAGLPSAEISAAPWPARLEITPSSANRSAGPGPSAADAMDCGALSKPAMAVWRAEASPVEDGLVASGKTTAGVDSFARSPQYTALAAARAHSSPVTRRSIHFVCIERLSLKTKNFSSVRHGGPGVTRWKASRLTQLAQRGFTLIELMVVLVIIGVLAALIVPNVLDRADDARVTAARTDINNLMQALKLYRLDNQRYPSAEQGLQALVARPTAGSIPPNWKPTLEKLPNDPWARPYQYLNPGIQGEIDVMSLGADGQVGGEGKNADLGSWQ